MSHTTFSTATIGCVLTVLCSASGCMTDFGPTNFVLGGWGSIPIPVTPFLQDRLEDNAWQRERYEMVPILGPFTQGGPVKALDPPSQDEIMRALEKARPLEGGLPFLYETQRDNVRMTVEPLDDYVDPPRIYPLIGPAQLHHAHYKCTIHFREVDRIGWPIPYTRKNEDAQEVIYIDHNHLHMVGNIDPGMGSEY